jgi:hypothetical protein
MEAFCTVLYRRTPKNRHELPVLVILHGSHVLGLSTVEELLNRTIGVTVTCTPLDFGQGKDYADASVNLSVGICRYVKK